MVKEITNDNFNETVKDGVSLIKFGAPWCGPCRQLAPIIDKLAEKFNGTAIIGDVNVDNNQELAAQFSIRSVPTTIVFKDGEEVDRTLGFIGADSLTEKINKIL